MKKRLLAAGMAAFLLTSCSSLFEPIGESSGSSGSESSAAESSGTEEQNAPLLSFRIQDETFIVNTAGKEILSGKNLWLIQDLFTNEAPFITKSRYEAVKRDEDGWIEQHRTFTTVYDRNGKEIQSETEGDLNAVFGDYVVWMESNDSINGKLVRRSTGEVLFNDVNSAAKLGSSYVVVYHNTEGAPPTLVDANGTFSELEDFYSFYTSGDPNYFVSLRMQDAGTGLIDAQLREVLPPVYVTVQVTNGYALTWDGAESEVWRLPEAEKIRTIGGEKIQYFDGEVMVLCNEDYNDDYYLADASGEPLTQPGSYLFYAGNNESPVKAFCSSGSGSSAILYGRDGTLLYEKENASIVPVSSDRFVVSWAVETGEGDSIRYDSHCLVLNEKGEEVIPEGTYQWISNWGIDGTCIAAFHGGRTSGLYDLLDPECKVLLSDLKWVESAGNGYYLVEKGFSEGIMDKDGNWIYQTTQFRTLDDE